MSANNNDNTNELIITKAEKELLCKLRQNPYYADQIFALTEEFHREVENGMDADEAESLLIESLQKLGSSMMLQWADTTQSTQVAKLKEEQSLHNHSKKNSNGTLPLEQ